MDTTIKGSYVAESFGGLCCIKGCSSPELASGLCNKHWRRLKKYGSPVWLQMPAGAYRGMDVVERFLTRVNKSDGCWLWTGGVDSDGYGLFQGETSGVVYRRAHRFSWAYYNKSAIPEEMSVCHSCDTPACVNPAHLSLGTNAENQNQKWDRNRGNVMFGENHYRARITAADVEAIRMSTEPQQVLAKRYGLTQPTISDIRRRKSWRHLK